MFFRRQTFSGEMPEAIRKYKESRRYRQFENSVWLEAEDLFMGVMSIGKAAGVVNHELIP